eukprot:superscaffoldBa00001224_g9589
MEYSERVLCGSGEVELDPNIVSEEAGKLYSELQTVIETHGESVVESLVPIFVWVLEGLASCKAQLRDREEEAEREKAEREELLERYQAEKALRKESQERYLELDDQTEQERRAMRGREKERERRERDLEKKAREQADQLVALEEQKANLNRELSTLMHTYNKLAHTHRDLLEKRRDSERDSPLRNHIRPKNSEFPSIQVSSESSVNDKTIQRPHSNSGPPCLEDLLAKEEKAIDIAVKSTSDQFVSDIISSTPELRQFHGWVDASMEWELRNTDSVFSELSELSRDYVESVDRGASVRGSADQFEEILSQYEELKVTNELVEAARKALLSRVVELTDDRSALKLEVTSLQETASRLEGRMKEKEEEIKRLRKELEACQAEDPDASLPTSMRHFSRSEMARVVMEKNQYKQRLFELQEAIRRSQALRRRELYREIRSHIWGTLGKRQIHGWSTPLANTQESHELVPEPKDVPVLVQLRLLDQRDSTAKLNCAVAVTPEISGEATCSVWVVSGPPSSSDITVIDPARSNTVLDQFSLPPTAPALCICAVPPIGDATGTVWIGTQEGSILVHSASAGRRRCLQSVSLSEGIHSLTYSQGQVIAGLADGTLAFFSHSSGDWNLQSHTVMPLGSNPLQPIRCCLAKGGRLWVGYWNKVHVVDIDSQSFLTLSPLQISSLIVISGRLWVGTGGGAVFSIPLSITQLCYHGHRQAVRFIIAAPGCLITCPGSSTVTTSQLILSGGEGYINFRIGDDANDGSAELSQATPQRSERSHMIIWQNPTPPLPSPAL